jgi:uncharacterized protein (TIGR02147 family)
MNAAQVNLFEYLDYRTFLLDFISAKKEVNPHFSLRSLALRLGCNAGFLNRILKGSRNLSGQNILKLADLLRLNAKQRHYFELLVHYNQSKKQVEKDHFFRQLDLFRSSKVKQTAVAQYALYSEWYFTVLRELINIIPCKDHSDDTCKLLARYLDPRVTVDQVRQALSRLSDLGLLARKSDGTFSVKERFITSGADIPQVVINRVLMQFMELAQFSLDRFKRRERSLSTLTFSVSEKGFEKVQEKLDQYRREILAIVNDDRETIDRVYHLNLHLFPVSRSYRGSTR